MIGIFSHSSAALGVYLERLLLALDRADVGTEERPVILVNGLMKTQWPLLHESSPLFLPFLGLSSVCISRLLISFYHSSRRV